MYSVILMTAMTASAPEAPQFFCHRPAACSGCVGCYGGCTGCFGYSCHGCTGCFGYSSCFGCTGCSGYSSCHGCCGGRGGFLGLFHHKAGCHGGGSCYGCTGCCGGYYLSCAGCCGGCSGANIYGAPVMPPPAQPAPIMTRADYSRRVWGANWSYSDSVPFQVTPPAAPAIRYDNTPPKVEKKISIEQSAKLTIEVPAEAKLYIDGSLTKSSGELRRFYTPKLDPNQLYFYDVRVEFEKNGKTVRQDKRVYVKAGDEFYASFKAIGSATHVAKN